MSFKSYGNVPNGVAVVSRIPIAEIVNKAPKITWTKTFAPFITAKAARHAKTNVAVLLWGEGAN